MALEARNNSGFVVCQLAILLALCVSVSASGSVPAFVWSSTGCIRRTTSMDYQTVSVEKLASDLFGALKVVHTEDSAEETSFSVIEGDRPELVLAFIGKELNTQHLAQYGEDPEFGADPLGVIKASINNAASSLVLPYIAKDKFSANEPMAATVLKSFQETSPEGEVALMGDCQVAPEGGKILQAVDDVKGYLEMYSTKKAEGKTTLLLICAPTPEADSTRDGLLRESGIFSAAYSIVQDLGMSHIVLYTTDPTESLMARRQALVTSTLVSTNRTCDDDCLTKARLLEVLAVALVLLITLLSGLCCLGAVDAPTRFEGPRDS